MVKSSLFHAKSAAGDAQGQQKAEPVKPGDREIHRSHAEGREQPGAGERPGDARRVGGRARHAHRRHQRAGRHRLADQRVAHALVGRPDQSR